MRKLLLHAIATAVGAIALASGAQAYNVTVLTANTSGPFNADANGSFFSRILPAPNGYDAFVGASFQYLGPLTFNVATPQNSTSAGDTNADFFSNGTIVASSYSYGGTGKLAAPGRADFSTLDAFLASSGSNAGYGYGSLLVFDLGVLAAGTTLTVTHDDGFSIYQRDSRIGNTTTGPTEAITETVTLTNTDDTTLIYSRQNGAPSVLNVQVAAVPEPETYALMAVGLLGMAFLRRSRHKA